jgi:hypothetical protein
MEGLKHYEFEIKFQKQALNKVSSLLTVTDLNDCFLSIVFEVYEAQVSRPTYSWSGRGYSK